MKRLFVLVIALLWLLPAAAQARDRVLHVGQADPVACGVKWMISGAHGHRPNIYRVAGTYQRPLKPGCNYFGKALGQAVVAYKFRLGYPLKLVKPVIGPYFVKLLKGPTDQRPLLWIAYAQRRARAIQAGPTLLARQIVAFESKQVGTAEQGQNTGTVRGPGGYSVDMIEASQGVHGLEWCAIFQSFGFAHVGVQFAPPPYYRFRVASIGQWGLDHGYALYKGRKVYRAYVDGKARVGALVAFLSTTSTLSAHHVGLVAAITAKGYYTLEGNSGDAVRRHWYPWGSSLRVFIHVPAVS